MLSELGLDIISHFNKKNEKMKNLLFSIILISTLNCQKNMTNFKVPYGLYAGKATIKTTVIRSNNEVVNLESIERVEVDFDKKIMYMPNSNFNNSFMCTNRIQFINSTSLFIGKDILKCPDNGDCACFFSNDTATYSIRNDLINFAFKELKTERQYNFTEKDISTILRSIELKKQ